jgi:hypothetical protein
MTRQHEIGIRVCYIALLMGILGDWLLRAGDLGINAFLWIAVIAVSATLLIRSKSGGRKSLQLLGGFALLLGAAIAWRDSSALKTISVIGVIVVLSLGYAARSESAVRRGSVLQYCAAGLIATFSAVTGIFPLLLSDLDFKSGDSTRRATNLFAVGRGLLISIPILALFGALLTSADAAFQKLMTSFVNFSIPDLLLHIFLIVMFGWPVAGYLRGLLAEKRPASGDSPRAPFKQFGIIEIGMPLALLDILFLLFVVVQFRYFFGGAAHVQSTTGLAYSEYARRGFFELVAVAALVLPLLLACHGLLDKSNPKHEFIFRVIAGAQVVLLFVIMASALQRMRLYQQEYGMTELRLYTVAFMGWIATVFICFAFTVLRGRTAGFAFASLLSGFAVAGILLIMNPDAVIVKVNAARTTAEVSFDTYYNSSLGADAVPALIEALPRLDPSARSKIANSLLLQLSSLETGDWRTWSLSRYQARVAIESNKTQLEQWGSERAGR